MPEGPEAFFLAKMIHDNFSGLVLQNIQILAGRYKKHGPPPGFDCFLEALPLTLNKVYKKGKVIVLSFDKDWNIISRLGLTGWWYPEGQEPDWQKPRQNMVFEFGFGLNINKLIFSDMLSYGTLKFSNDPNVIECELQKLAPDFLGTEVTIADIHKRLDMKKMVRRENALIEDVIMDQELIMSGVGNYLKAEILYRSGIAPTRMIKTLDLADWQRILLNAQIIGRNMVTSLEKHNQEDYMGQMQVYMKKVDPHGNNVIKHKSKGGRTTFWVPELQK